MAAIAEIALAYPGRVPDDSMRVWAAHIYDLSPQGCDLRDGVTAMCRASQHPSLAALVAAIDDAKQSRIRRQASMQPRPTLPAPRRQVSDVGRPAEVARQIAIDIAMGRLPQMDEIEFQRTLETRLAGPLFGGAK